MYRAILIVAFGLMLTLSVGAAGLVWWSASEARYHITRTRLAHDVLDGELRLKAKTFAVFRRMATTLRRPAEHPFDERAERAALVATVDQVRQGIAREVAFVRDRAGEVEELQRLAVIERGLLDFFARWREAAVLLAAGRQAEGRELFLEARDDMLAEGFEELIDRGIAEEQAETAVAYREAEQELNRLILTSRLGAGGSLLFAAVALFLLLRLLRRPLDELTEAARSVAAGNLARRAHIGPIGGEFARVAASFNAMVDEVERSRTRLEDSQRGLEQAVAERTAELAAATARLKHADAQRRRFLADVSHELRTPLTVIRGEAEVALRGKALPVPEYRSALARIAEQVAHTGRLVDDLLFVARAEAGEPRLVVQEVALDALVRRAVADAEALAQAARVSCRIPADLCDCAVMGDAGRLRQLLLILLDNALRYSDPGTEVEVSLASTADGLAVGVADRGIGIGPEELPHVFERFWRSQRAVELHGEGAGLGLPLAKAIAEAHGGTIVLAARLRGGTSVTVMLPTVRPTTRRLGESA